MFVSHRLTTVAGTVIAGAALSVAAFASAGTASANATDDSFLSQISAQDIGFKSPQGALQAAAAVCQLMGDGESAPKVMNDIMSATDLQSKQAAFFVVASVKTYCPQYDSQLNA